MFGVRRSTLCILGIIALTLLASFAGCDTSDDPARPAIDTVPPAIPDGIAAWASSAQGVTLSWSANVSDPDLAGYIVYRSDASESSFRPMQTSPLTSNSWSDSHAQAGRSYAYRVSARDTSNNESAYSTTFIVQVPDHGNDGNDDDPVHP